MLALFASEVVSLFPADSWLPWQDDPFVHCHQANNRVDKAVGHVAMLFAFRSHVDKVHIEMFQHHLEGDANLQVLHPLKNTLTSLRR